MILIVSVTVARNIFAGDI